MPTILVVDDVVFMRISCAKMLKKQGYDVVEAENGSQALEVYQKVQPDGVLMDITMPEMDGLEALKAMRELDPNARVAMLTAAGEQAIVMEALESGARGFIVKPFEKERVLAAVAKLLA